METSKFHVTLIPETSMLVFILNIVSFSVAYPTAPDLILNLKAEGTVCQDFCLQCRQKKKNKHSLRFCLQENKFLFGCRACKQPTPP